MNKQKYYDYLKSPEWQEIKRVLYESRGYECQKCGHNKNIHVHHLHYRNIFNEDPADLVLLCKSCHMKEHPEHKKKKPSIKQKLIRKAKKKHKPRYKVKWVKGKKIVQLRKSKYPTK